ncbi:hypothetical protein HDF16_001592 [Granulicella aggregans]|uniref:Uncharacterized protein n=1 Tax=Granulicella aggregans TaxID=474949 RepID=A0A7W7ZBU6_9BACT|nr:hypothetical protein [Granulicella aggregans]MBB5056907.1 hypothetical protein [Granulicella aggregans]
MSTNKQTPVDIDPFLEGANIDWRGLGISPTTKQTDDHGFWNLDSDKQFKMPSVETMLRDPAIRRELAKKDPNMAAALIDEKIGEVAEEFRRRNPEYMATDRNLSAIVLFLAERHVGKAWLDDETAINRLYDCGHWTPGDLTSAYKSLLKAGKLDVPRGTRRALTEQEKLDVIAQIRTGDIENGIVNYVLWSLNGASEEYSGPADFIAKNPELSSEAAQFCWFHSRAGEVDAATFRDFQREKLAGHRLLTVHLLDKAWESWKAARKYSQLFSDGGEKPETVAPASITRRDLESLSPEESDRLYQQSLREYARSRR